MTEEQTDERQRPPLTRSSGHRVVAGVCGGLGRYLDIDPVVFRVVTVVLCLSGGLGLFVYGLAWLIVPREDGGDEAGRTELQRVLTGRVDGQSIGALVMAAIGMAVFFSAMGSDDQLLPLLLLGGLGWLAVRYDPQRRASRAQQPGPEHNVGWTEWGHAFGQDLRSEFLTRKAELHEHFRQARAQQAQTQTQAQAAPADAPPPYRWDPRDPQRHPFGGPVGAWWQRTDLPPGDPLRKPYGPTPPPPAPPVPPAQRVRQPRSFLGLLGLLLALCGGALAWWISVLRGAEVRVSTVLAAALLGLGLALLAGAKFGRARGLTVPALVLTFALVGSLGTHINARTAVGDRHWVAASASELQPTYSLGAGNARLDLSKLDPAGATVHTTVQLGTGDLTVVVPRDVAVRLTLRQTVGEASLPNGDRLAGSPNNSEYDVLPQDGQPAKGTLDLTLRVGVGGIRVVQE